MTEQKEPKLHSGRMEIAVANLLNYRVYTIVPNVSWGAGFKHECDMLAIDSAGRLTEIEIKVSLSDLKADFKKGHNHESKFISRLIYAIPESMLEKSIPLIPEKCGIITVRWAGRIFKANWYRKVKHDKEKQKPTPEKIANIMRLGCMRIWSLKEHNYIREAN